MADVPLYQEDTTNDTPETTRFAPVRDTSGPIVQAGQQISGDLAAASQVRQNIDALQDEAAVKQLALNYDATRRDLLYSPNGFFSQQGVNAGNAVPATSQALTDARDDLIGQTTNNRQLRMFSDYVNAKVSSDQDQMATYTQAQTVNYYKTSSEAAISNHIENYTAKMATGDPTAQSELDAATIERGRLNGFIGGDQDTLTQSLVADRTKAHTAVIGGMLAQGNPDGALVYFNQHQGEMDPMTRAQTGERLKTDADSYDSFKAARSRLASGADAAGGTGASVLGGPNGEGATIGPSYGMHGGAVAQAITQRATAAGLNAQDAQNLVTMGVIESGLNGNVKPNGSSQGLFQFHQDTFDRVAPGKNINSASDQIDAAITLYKQNKQALTDAGLPVNSTSLYLAHQQGLGGAKALLSAPANQSAVQALLPVYNGNLSLATQAVANNAGSPNATVGQFIQTWQAKMLSNGAAASSAVGNAVSTTGSVTALPDRETYVNGVVSMAGPDVMRQKAFEAAAESQWAKLHGFQKDKEQEAYAVAQPIFGDDTVKTYQDFVQAAGPDTVAALNPHTLNGIQRHYAAAAGSGQYSKQDDAPTIAALSNLYATNPKQFAALDLTTYAPKLTDGSFKQMLGDQAKVIKDGQPDPIKAVTISHAMQVSNGLIRSIYPNEAQFRQNAGQFQGALQAKINQFVTQTGKQPGDTDIPKMADELLLQGSWKTGNQGFLGIGDTAAGREFQAPTGAPFTPAVPGAARDRIVRDFAAVHNGQQPNDTQIQQRYVYGHKNGIFH